MRTTWFSALILILISLGCRRPQPAGNEVRVHLSQEPGSLNPVNYSSKDAMQLINLLYQSLLTVDLADGKLKPLLAESMPEITRQDSVSLFTYRIRPEATWPNGSPVTAADVEFTLKVMKSPLVNNENVRPDYEFVQDILLYNPDPKKFTLVCLGYTPEYLLLTGDFFVLPAALADSGNRLAPFTLPQLTRQFEALAANQKIQEFAEDFNSDKFTRNPSFLQGSAGYQLDSWTTGQSITFKRRENWWGNKLQNAVPQLTANPEKVRFRIIPDHVAALQALRNNQLDAWQNIPAPVFQNLRKDPETAKQFRFFTPLTYNFVYIALNARLPQLAGKKTRQALAHLLDTDMLVKTAQQNLAVKTVGPVIPTDKQHYHSGIQPYTFDTGKATTLLKADGWQKAGTGWQKKINGQLTDLKLKINYKAGNSEFESIGLVFQEAAAKIGIPVTLEPLEGVLLSKKLKQSDFEMAVRTLSGSPFVFNFKPILHTSSAGPDGMNYAAFGTPESDSLIEKIYTSANASEKAGLLKRFQEILHEESNLIFLYFLQDRLAINRRYTNLKVSGIKPGYDVSAFTLQEN